MKKTYLLLAFVLATMFAQAQRNDRGLNFGNTPLPTSLQGVASWDLLPDYSDDFNHNNKNSAKFQNVWSQSYLPDPGFRGPGSTRWVGGNGAEVRSGKLEIIARPGPNGLVDCGIVTSKRTVKYPVYMEARIKVSNIRNSSNFWMLNACDNEEIDVLEVYGGDPDQFYSKQMSTNFHIWHRRGGQSHAEAQTTVNCGGEDITDFTYQTFFTTNPNSADLNNTANWRDAYHTFGVYWGSPTQIEFYIDGQPRFNGQHFVGGRNASGLDGSFEDARLQCPNAEILRCATNELLRNVQGQSGGGVPYPNREFNDPTFIILDTEAHAGRPLESVANLNNNSRNVMKVDWVRVYRPNFGGGGGGNTDNNTDTVNCSPLPSSVNRSNSITVNVNYTASTTRDVVVEFKQFDDDLWLGQGTTTVNAGSGTASVTINLQNTPANGNNYRFVTSIRPQGANWMQNIEVCRTNRVTVSSTTTTPQPPPPAPTTGGAPIGSTIWLKANNGAADYVQARLNLGNAPLGAVGGSIGTWEQFTVVDAGGGLIALKAKANDKYVQARINETNAPLYARGGAIAGWEKFIWESRGNGKVALKSNQNGKYVQARLNINGAPLAAFADNVAGWETFDWGVVGTNLKINLSDLDAIEEAQIQLYPNPVKGDNFKIDLGTVNTSAKIQVMNLQGQLIYATETTDNYIELEANILPVTGIYLIHATIDGVDKMIKVVKE